MNAKPEDRGQRTEDRGKPDAARGLQRRFGFADVGSGRPLCDIGAAMFLLDRDEDGILHLIEDGQIEYAFDIAAPKADSRELRIWHGSLSRFVAARVVNGLPADQVGADVRSAASKAITIDQVTHDILPGASAHVTAVQLKRAFNCSSTHVHNLIASGALQELATEGRRKTNTRRVCRDSSVNFLTSRRVQ